MKGARRGGEHRKYREYLRKVSALLDALAAKDLDAVSMRFRQVCDGPDFDEAIAEAMARKNDEDHFDRLALQYDLLSLSSIDGIGYRSTSGHAHAPIQLFFVPLSGRFSMIESACGNKDRLTEIGKSFIQSGLASQDSIVIVSGSLLDPMAASSVSPGKIRLALRMVTPVLTIKTTSEHLGDALSSVFSCNAPTMAGDYLAHRLLPVARIVTTPDGSGMDTPLSPARIDDVANERQAVKRWRGMMQEIMPGVLASDPSSIMRGRSVMAANMIEHAFLSRASRLGHQDIPEMDRITLVRNDDLISVSGRCNGESYGPVEVPTGLFSSDMSMMTEYVEALANEVRWLEPSEELRPPRPGMATGAVQS